MEPSLILPFLAVAALPAFAGETAVPKAPISPAAVSPAAVSPANPLSFFGGKLVFDFEERVRFEARENNFDFNSGIDSVTDDSWLLQRVRFGALFAPMPYLKFYAQGQDSREFWSDRPNVPGQMGAEGNDPVDLHQAWIQLGDPKSFPVTLKLGRQILSYGDERLVGAFDWNNFSRVFDAAKLTYTGSNWSIDAFGATVVPVYDHQFNESDISNGTGRDQFFGGLHFTTKGIAVQTTELYAYYLNESDAAGDTGFITLGTHMKSEPGQLNGFDYNFEGVVQFGEVKGVDLTAGAVTAGAGYTFADVPWKPRIGLEYNYGTGDSDKTDGENNTFQNLFPTNHKFYGYADFFSWQNINNPSMRLTLTPSKTVSLQADYHLLWLAETNDAWYRANGSTKVRPPAAGKSGESFVGSELDLTATWKPVKNLGFAAGYSYFFGGDYAKASGPSDDADFVYAQMTINF